ncbi:MAG: hypothetical protein BWY06_00936 [Candidatus Latescibacteria bacterium ADurb.Bin168]|nr:MAG: hypothetical protein BWY06_00936 [Candidatus Latescibacteria bacterium ADurb.Bin168]
MPSRVFPNHVGKKQMRQNGGSISVFHRIRGNHDRCTSVKLTDTTRVFQNSFRETARFDAFFADRHEDFVVPCDRDFTYCSGSAHLTGVCRRTGEKPCDCGDVLALVGYHMLEAILREAVLRKQPQSDDRFVRITQRRERDRHLIPTRVTGGVLWASEEMLPQFLYRAPSPLDHQRHGELRRDLDLRNRPDLEVTRLLCHQKG